ncbi:hypothetical protein ABZ259_08440 [Streptomyces cyaneofuscatus]
MVHESILRGRAGGLIEDKESIIPGRRVGEQDVAMSGVQPYALHRGVGGPAAAGDVDEVQGLGEVAGATAGEGEFLVGHRPVVRFGEVLEVAGRGLHDAGRVVVPAVLAQRRAHPQTGPGAVPAGKPVVDGEGFVVAGGSL